ncbi:Alkylhydroperoxidase family enzyme, contains CxxC motif [Actinopolymorpha cephalotaxi]|uniref:Alkylhydroperoxidase family enzyme n=1 Tax=Actinopolymorpha cephalotaxi TaxID=504797 RepID=A0A1I3B1W4_9ACTN|nr:carboxymuconolactone decarboxylase family protein [Actinopolymorpha cephalotaxi]NYH84251.1 alkylhydroperoxidase family enzyme [Actinopolymorpha cephalotaxi]SFH55939.1 Alkylhydroperoxidase family enzyme, contains CxxC motif [Actinopolymorpha cephalotaxi]
MPYATTPRIRPLPIEELEPEQRKLAKLGADTVIQVLARNPELTRASSDLGAYLLSQGRLHPRIRELAILRVALHCDAPYEWANHVPAALGAGATADEINALSEPTATWEPEDDAVLRATDELCKDAFVSDATWTALAATRDDDEILELLFLVGYYRMMAGFLNSAGVAVKPSQPVLGEQVLPPQTTDVRVATDRPSSGKVGADGLWSIMFVHPAGSKEIVLDLKTADGTVSGTMFDTMLGVTAPIVSGTVDPDGRLEFTAEMTEPARFDLDVAASIDGDTFTGSVTIAGGGTFPFSGTRAE